MSGGSKIAAQPAPLLKPWLAFVAAGACGVVAGDLAVSVPTWTAIYSELGVELPWITQVVVDGGLAVPGALVGAAIGLLAMGGVRAERRPWTARASEAGGLVACGALVGAALLFVSTMLAFLDGQRQLMQ